jgi:hypothetical protein
MSLWSVKGDSTVNVIMWIGGILAVLICVTWYMQKVYPIHISVERADQDLTSIQGKINSACNSFGYESRYNPVTEKGVLTINGSVICINATGSSSCREALCSINDFFTADLENITDIRFIKNESGIFVS